jgi:transmembrane sensor
MDANERRRLASREASQWWGKVGLRSTADLTPEERQQFTQWLRESPLHVAEMLHMAHVHDALGRFRHWDEVATGGARDTDDNVVELPVPAPPDSGRASRPQRGWRVFALAAGLCALAVGGGWLWAGRGELIVTDRAERREVMLDDGSVVRLEPESMLRVSFEDHERRVTLSRGRALFHVAKDPGRPFIVEADQTMVRAVGTAFGVEHNREGVVVTVAEGKVAVRTEGEPGDGFGPGPSPMGAEAGASEDVFLTAGKQVVVQRSGSREAVRDVDSARALAWSEGRLVFDGVPLGEVAEEFNRYNHIQLRITGEALSRRPVSGVFQATDPETLVAFISAGAQVVVSHPDRLHIVIESRVP